MITKFMHGAYLVVIAIPVLCVIMQSIHRHYAAVRAELRTADEDEPTLPSRIHAIVLISGWDERMLESAAKLCEAHGLELLGTFQKPVKVKPKAVARPRAR